jgi:UDP-N-acetylmuramyl pentapeptide phosphotransferase/UDP-N-acetylglucosamine-1-phosphate transferase
VLVTVSVTIASALLSIHLEKRLNVLCVDVHKVTKPRVPCNGGFAIFSGLVTGTLLALLTGCVEAEVGEAVLLSLAIAFCIGLADDLVDLNSGGKYCWGFCQLSQFFFYKCIPQGLGCPLQAL